LLPLFIQIGLYLSALTDRPPWKTRFQSVSEENEQLREKAGSCEKSLREALRREEAIAARLDGMQKNVRSLADENQRLKSSQQHKWFLIGALVLLCGLLIGLMIGRKQRSRRFY
jgi:SH3 domain protein